MKVTVRSVYRWQQEQKQPKPKSERPPGRSGYLTKVQIKKLEQELSKGAYVHGYSEDSWTLDRVGRVIWDLYKVCYTPSGVWRLLEAWAGVATQTELVTAWTNANVSDKPEPSPAYKSARCVACQSQMRKVRLSVRSFQCNLRSEHVILLLKQVLRLVSGDIILVWDNHKIHASPQTQVFINDHPRMHEYPFSNLRSRIEPSRICMDASQ